MNWSIAHFEIVLVTLLSLLAAVVVLQQRRTPQSAAAWLIFIIAIPYVAIPLFLALGFRKRGGRFDPISFSDPAQSDPAQSDPDAPRPSLDLFLEHYGVPPATAGNSFKLVTTPQDAFRDLNALVGSAERDVAAMFYIVANDPVGTGFVEALTERARAGVKVRLLMDRLGSLKPPRAALADLRAAGGEVRYLSPFLQRPDSGHFNLRNHRKMVIADGERVFAGGMNVGAEYMVATPTTLTWTDLGYLLQGPAVRAFQDVFRSDWALSGGSETSIARYVPPAQSGTAVVQLVPSGPDTLNDPLHDALVNAIHIATKRIWIVTPYFLPTQNLASALSIAARRGVDVRILLPCRSNQKIADFARGAYLRDMQDSGSRILFFQRGMIHAKAGIIDDAGFVGSANFDVRSMLLNFETTLFVYDPDAVAQLTDWYLTQEQDCSEGLVPAGLLRRVSEGLFRLGAPVL